MEIAIWIVVINWGTTLLFWLYPLFMMLVFKDFVFEGFQGPFAKFRLANKDVESWHAKAWKDWAGVCLHWFICYRDLPGDFDDAQVERGNLHEGAHGYQQLLGLLWWVIHFGDMLRILVTQKIKGEPYTKHPYLDCIWERLARKRAGQLIDVPPDMWPQGKRDLWPWW